MEAGREEVIRFVDLNPRWCRVGSAEHVGEGVSFDCPAHRSHRLWIKFGIMWTKHGQRFETLTITPSIDARRSGCPHFNVTNGEVVIL